MCESRRDNRKGFVSPSPGRSQGLFSFLSLILFHSHRPPTWAITACALLRWGSRNVWICFCRVLPPWLYLTSSYKTVSSVQCLLNAYGSLCPGDGGGGGGQAAPRKPTRSPAFKESLQIGPARQSACWGRGPGDLQLFLCTSRFSWQEPGAQQH